MMYVYHKVAFSFEVSFSNSTRYLSLATARDGYWQKIRSNLMLPF